MSKKYCLVGAHTAGKTSIGKRLLHESHIDYFGHEIGKEYFYSGDLDPDTAGVAYEHAITKQEVDRDHLIFNNYKDSTCVLETWHIGNLAYLLTRNPSGEKELIEVIKRSPIIESVDIIYLTVSRDNIISRTTNFKDDPHGAAEFYLKIQDNIEKVISNLKLEHRVCRINADQDFEDVFGLVCDRVSQEADL
ncbi:MAG: hypothetical protein KC478_16650 [Bacteriovoracaceae bacterium]|nr:hypothetical protein [Bacteriovoracaceae bacterium]